MADLAKTKLQLRITGTAEDERLQQLLNAVTTALERFIGYAISQDSFNETHDGEGMEFFFTDNPNIVRINFLYVNANRVFDANSLVSQSNFITDFYIGKIIRTDSNYFDIGQKNIFVGYAAGFAVIPDDLDQAIINMVGAVFNRIRSGGLGVKSLSIGDFSITFETDDGGSASFGMPEETKALIAPYVRRFRKQRDVRFQ